MHVLYYDIIMNEKQSCLSLVEIGVVWPWAILSRAETALWRTNHAWIQQGTDAQYHTETSDDDLTDQNRDEGRSDAQIHVRNRDTLFWFWYWSDKTAWLSIGDKWPSIQLIVIQQQPCAQPCSVHFALQRTDVALTEWTAAWRFFYLLYKQLQQKLVVCAEELCPGAVLTNKSST